MARQERAVRRKDVGIQLTKRDEALLRALRRFRVARTSDLIRFAFPKARRDTAATRLRRLFDAEFLAVRSEGQARENLYSVGPRGRQWLKGLGLKLESVPRGSLEHHLAIVRTWIDVAVAVQQVPDLRLVSARPDWELRKGSGARRLVPDLLAVLQDERGEEPRRFALAMEVDRGTESLWVLRRKFERYDLEGLDGEALGQEIGIGVVLMIRGRKRQEGLGALLRQVWSGWHALWTVTEGPTRGLRELQEWMEGPPTGSPYGKGRIRRVSACGATGPVVRGGGL